jgi:hypothetical protein
MVTYEITTRIDLSLVASYERYMVERHIPDLLATGLFEAVAFTRAEPGRYRTRYEAPNQAALQEYLDTHAQRLRADFAAHFPDGVQVDREVWHWLQAWPAPAPGAA